jgi:hypothetical protein
MIYRPPLRSSRAARASRWAGGFAVPLLILTLIEHRADVITTPQSRVLIGLSFGLAAIAILAAIVGFVVIWERGFHGARNAILGLFYASIALLPALYIAYGIARHPALTDISTDWTDPPLYAEAAFLRVGRLNSVAPPSPEQIERQKLAYPDLVTRHFGIGSEQLFRSARKVVEHEGWKVLSETAPREDGDPGRIEAVARTQVFGEENDIVVRVRGESSGAAIDVRSSSRYGSRDLGQNANRIRGFFSSLNAAVTENFGN